MKFLFSFSFFFEVAFAILLSFRGYTLLHTWKFDIYTFYTISLYPHHLLSCIHTLLISTLHTYIHLGLLPVVNKNFAVM
jgi:hypothetical protein